MTIISPFSSEIVSLSEYSRGGKNIMRMRHFMTLHYIVYIFLNQTGSVLAHE